MKEPSLVIMAAGAGSRYGGPKQMEKVDDSGHTIIDYSIYDAVRAGFRDVIFIISKEIEREFREMMAPRTSKLQARVRYVLQDLSMLPEEYRIPIGRRKPWGTAHAIACLGEIDAPFAVINADDYYGALAFEEIYSFLSSCNEDEKQHYAMVSNRLGNSVSRWGAVSRGICRLDECGKLVGITEINKIYVRNEEICYFDGRKEQGLDPKSVVSMNLWGFSPSFASECRKRFAAFLESNLLINPLECEFYIPSVVSELISEGRADVRTLESDDKWYGITYREDKEELVHALKILREQGKYPFEF